jgi:surface protein
LARSRFRLFFPSCCRSTTPLSLILLRLIHLLLFPLARGRSRAIIFTMVDPASPTAKQQMTTAAAAAADDEQEPASIRDEERRRTTTANDNNRTVLDLLRSLPANIVASYIYPFAVKVIHNHEELIKAVDEHLDEFYGEGLNQRRRIGGRPAGRDVGNHRIRYPIGDWDVSRVNNFISIFNYMRKNFNDDLSRWNVAKGTSFARMFNGCYLFNSDLSNWNTGRASNLSSMFCHCFIFNSDVSRWNVANATKLRSMFFGCTRFNSDVSRWSTANATNLRHMFFRCRSFNPDLSRWNVANATDLSCMFQDCTSFNSDLSRWNVANATDLTHMFHGCILFNSNVSQWDITSATGPKALHKMFGGCVSFNRDFVAAWPLPDEQRRLSMFVFP